MPVKTPSGTRSFDTASCKRRDPGQCSSVCELLCLAVQINGCFCIFCRWYLGDKGCARRQTELSRQTFPMKGYHTRDVAYAFFKREGGKIRDFVPWPFCCCCCWPHFYLPSSGLPKPHSRMQTVSPLDKRWRLALEGQFSQSSPNVSASLCR